MLSDLRTEPFSWDWQMPNLWVMAWFPATSVTEWYIAGTIGLMMTRVIVTLSVL